MTGKGFLSAAISAAVLAVILSAPARAADVADPAEVAACRSIEDPLERVNCYDRLFGSPQLPQTQVRPGSAGVPSTAEASVVPAAPTDMAIRWELDRGTNRGLWLPRGYRRTYILPARWTSDVNDAPQSPTQRASYDGPLDSVEAKFQLSLKLKAADDMFGTNADLWVGYTQQSFWQVYNRELSRPFRETDYEPEVFATIPARFQFLGLTGRMINVGAVHQSNGQSDPRSRSWNRVYAEVGFERGAFSLLVRPWLRIHEAPKDDNNPDITDYVGRGDLVGLWSHGDHTVSLMLRSSFSNEWHGAGQLDYSFPILGSLKGYLQLFSGYGESLIDYNHKQTTVGLGVLVVDLK